MGLPFADPFGKPGNCPPLDFRDLADIGDMRPHLAVVNGIDPEVTERFLLSQPNVVNASVWYHRGRLHAEVAVVPGESVTPERLRSRCSKELGPNQAPIDITLVMIRPRAA